MDAELQQLHDALAQTMAPNQQSIKAAEAFLQQAAERPGFAVQVLKARSDARSGARAAAPPPPTRRHPLPPPLTRRLSAAALFPQLVSLDAVAPEVRQQGAVQFKNHVKFQWAPRAGGDGGAAAAIPDAEKETVRAHLLDLMLSAPPRARAQLGEALAIISRADFPARWPALLPQLLARMGEHAGDPEKLGGVLSTADAVFARYRGQFMTDALSAELEYSQAAVRPLLAATQALAAAAAAAAAAPATPPAALARALDNARLVLAVFFSLNSPGLTEEFEATLDAWMAALHALLTLSAPAAAPADEDEEGPLDALKATACECLALFMERNEEEFARFLPTFVKDVWTEATSAGAAPGRDRLVVSALGFLAAVARSVHGGLFGEPGALAGVAEGAVVPNLRLRDADVELFEDDWLEYVRRDAEGGDADTRRRAAAELVRALVGRFPAEATALFGGLVRGALAEAAADPAAGWRAKDAAVYLVTAVAAKARTAAGGAAATNELVDLAEFFSAHVAPELAAPAVDARPVVKADCLRFGATFRGALPPAADAALLAGAGALLRARSNVVHSYAATLLERLLAAKRAGAPALPPAELAPRAGALLAALFGALALPGSGENEYVMRAVARLAAHLGAALPADARGALLAALAGALLRAAANPAHPGFNHWLFEAAAAAVRGGAAAPGGVAALEGALFPPFQAVLQEDVQEFHPYVFQVLAQLVEARVALGPAGGGLPLPEAYLQLLPPLLAPVFWERPGNVPALARLLRAFVAAAPAELAARGALPGALGVLQKLISSKTQDHEGLALLDALTLSLDPAALAPFEAPLWTLLFQRLQAARTAKFTRRLAQSAALVAARRGGAALAAALEGVQPGAAAMFAGGVWAPGLGGSGGAVEDKVAAVGAARFLAEAPPLQAEGAAPAWGALLDALLRRLGGAPAAGAGAPAGGDENEAPEAPEEVSGYAAAYAKLHYAARAEPDPLPEAGEARGELAQRLAAAGAAAPGRIARRIAAHVSPEAAAELARICAAAGVALA